MKLSRIGVAVALLFLLAGGFLHAQSAADSGGGSSIAPAAPTGTDSVGGLSQPSATSEPAAGAAPAKTEAAAVAPIKLPAGYGGASASVLTPGEGRFAQPPIRFNLSLGLGYDDNVFSTPDHPASTPQYYDVLTSYKAESRFLGHYNINLGGLAPTKKYELVPVPVYTRIDIPPAQQKTGSAVTRANLSFQTQSAAPRTTYTLDLGLGATEYWNRPGDTLDYNGNVGFLFYHRLTPRMNFTAAGSASSASQPNYGNLYGPSAQTTGQYVSANMKLDLTYQVSARIKTDLAYNLDTTLYQQQTEQSGNLYNNTIGTEFYYLISPRATAVLNYRASSISYTQSEASNSTENFLLFGGDLDLSSRLHFNFRTGAQSKVYANTGSTGLSSPYFESGLNYMYARGSSVNWTTRYGFEESPSKNSSQKTVSFRTGMGIGQVLTARINASANLNFNRLTTSSTVIANTVSTDQDQLSVNLGLNYVFNPHLSFNLNYSFTQTMTTLSTSDYTRSQTFFGANYSF